MAKDDTFLLPTILTETSPEALCKAVAAERLRREQPFAKCDYSAVYVQRNGNGGSGNNGYTKYIAFLEFVSVEK
jgi:hypothetical protein